MHSVKTGLHYGSPYKQKETLAQQNANIEHMDTVIADSHCEHLADSAKLNNYCLTNVKSTYAWDCTPCTITETVWGSKLSLSLRN